MKNLLILIAIFALPLITVGQNTVSDNDKKNDTIVVETVANENASDSKVVLSTTAKAELDKMNYKKSNDLISIKAYRKSLQIKVKEIKIC